MKMPTSHDILKSDIRVYFEKNVNISNRIWLPYVIEYKLNELYE